MSLVLYSFAKNIGKLSLLSISLSAIFLLHTQPSLAQTPLVPQPSTAPLELSRLQPRRFPQDGSAIATNNGSCDRTAVVTAYTICQQQLTIPSLWWTNDQFGDKLVDNWLAYPAQATNAARIDLVVNRQIWSLLDYLERYEFVNHFGTVARDYGYNVRVFNYQKELLATYTCNFNSTPTLCNIQLEATGKAGVRGSSAQRAQ